MVAVAGRAIAARSGWVSLARLTPRADTPVAAGAGGHRASVSASAPTSSLVTPIPYADLIATCCTAYAQWKPVLGGIQVAASLAPLSWLTAPSVGTRFAGSFANASATCDGQPAAPLRQASASATTWSICTSALVSGPRRKSTMCPVYGSRRVPETTTHGRTRSRATSVSHAASTSLRVSQPLASTSAHGSPKNSRWYPSRGSGSVIRNACSDSRAAATRSASTGVAGCGRTRAHHNGTTHTTAVARSTTTTSVASLLAPVPIPRW